MLPNSTNHYIPIIFKYVKRKMRDAFKSEIKHLKPFWLIGNIRYTKADILERMNEYTLQTGKYLTKNAPIWTGREQGFLIAPTDCKKRSFFWSGRANAPTKRKTTASVVFVGL